MADQSTQDILDAKIIESVESSTVFVEPENFVPKHRVTFVMNSEAAMNFASIKGLDEMHRKIGYELDDALQNRPLDD